MDKIPNAFHTFHFDRHRVHGSFISSRLLTSQDSIPITYTLQLQTLLYSILLTLAIIFGLIIWNLEKIRHFMKTSFVLSHTNLIFVNSYSFSDYKKLFGSDIYSLLFYLYLCMLVVFIIAFQMIAPMVGDDWAYSSNYSAFVSLFIIIMFESSQNSFIVKGAYIATSGLSVYPHLKSKCSHFYSI